MTRLRSVLGILSRLSSHIHQIWFRVCVLSRELKQLCLSGKEDREGSGERREMGEGEGCWDVRNCVGFFGVSLSVLRCKRLLCWRRSCGATPRLSCGQWVGLAQMKRYQWVSRVSRLMGYPRFVTVSDVLLHCWGPALAVLCLCLCGWSTVAQRGPRRSAAGDFPRSVCFDIWYLCHRGGLNFVYVEERAV